MSRSDGQPVPLSEHDALKNALARAQDQLSKALEEGQDVMRGYSDAAAKASYASSIEQLRNMVAYRQQRLASFLAEAQVTPPTAQAQTIDEIMAEARRNSDVIHMEIWDNGRFVRELAHGAGGPSESGLVAERLCAEGTAGELRLIKTDRTFRREQVLAVYQLADHDPNKTNP